MEAMADAALTAGETSAGLSAGEAAGAERSEDEILGIAAEGADSDSGEEVVSEAADGEGAGAEGETQDGAASEDGEAALDADEVVSTVPAELKHLMSDRKVAPHIQRAFDQLAAYSKLGTVRDARTFALEFPGGVKEALNYKSAALDIAETDERFESGDIREQEALAQTWMEQARAAGRPEAFFSQVKAALNVLQKSDPQSYKQLTGGYAKGALDGELIASDGRSFTLAGQLDAIDAALQKAFSRNQDEQAEGIEALKGYSYFLTRELRAMGYGRRENGGARQPKEQEEFNRRAEEISQREEAARQREVMIFNRAVDADARTAVERSVRGQLGTLLKGTAFSEAGKAAILKDVMNGLDQKLKQSRDFQQTFKNMSRAARFDPEKRADLVNYITNRAKALISTVAKEVISRETGKFVAANAAGKQKTGARARVDITGGQAGGFRGMKLTREQMQGMTDQQKDEFIAAYLGV